MPENNWWEKHIHEIKERYHDEWYGWFEPGWYYADEGGSLHGPFDTREKAVAEIKGYATTLSGDPSDDPDGRA